MDVGGPASAVEAFNDVSFFLSGNAFGLLWRQGPFCKYELFVARTTGQISTCGNFLDALFKAGELDDFVSVRFAADRLCRRA